MATFRLYINRTKVKS